MREFVGIFGRKKNFAIPGFGERNFKVNRSETETFLQQASKTTYVEEHSQRFMAKNGREAAMYTEPVEWVSKFIGNVVINGKISIGTTWGKLLQRNLLNFKDPLSFSKTVFIKTTSFEDDLVNYLFESQG